MKTQTNKENVFLYHRCIQTLKTHQLAKHVALILMYTYRISFLCKESLTDLVHMFEKSW